MFNDQGYSSSMRLIFFNKIDSILKNNKKKKYFIDLFLYDIKYLEDIPMILTFTKYLTDSKQLWKTIFLLQEVEPMFKESDHIHIIALSAALKVGVRVKYMDRGNTPEVIAHDFPEGSSPAIHLLYRPGHYDILYPG